MTDIDTFAAAALTGLLADESLGHLGDTTLATRAYELASAMIEERERWNRAYAKSLTDEEREAIYRAEARLRTAYVPDDETAATLRKMLERLK
jgi:hypothetical protein